MGSDPRRAPARRGGGRDGVQRRHRPRHRAIGKDRGGPGRRARSVLSVPVRLVPAVGLRVLLRAVFLHHLLPDDLPGHLLEQRMASPRRLLRRRLFGVAPPRARADVERGPNRIVKTILVVDEEPQIAEIATDYLRLAGFDVVVAGDGVRALEAVRARHPDLVVLDLGLPKLGGLDVARTIRRHSDLPIIMLTARVEEDDRLHGLEIGADDYITKPFSPRELVARV